MTLTELKTVATNFKLELSNDIHFVIPKNEVDSDGYVKKYIAEIYERIIREKGVFHLGSQVITVEELDNQNLWDYIYQIIWLTFLPQHDIQYYESVARYYEQIIKWFNCHSVSLSNKFCAKILVAINFYTKRCVFYTEGNFYKGIQTQIHFDLLMKLLGAIVDCYQFNNGAIQANQLTNFIFEKVKVNEIDEKKAYLAICDMVFELDNEISFSRIIGKKVDLDNIAFVECTRPIEDYLKKRLVVPASAPTSAQSTVEVATGEKPTLSENHSLFINPQFAPILIEALSNMGLWKDGKQNFDHDKKGLDLTCLLDTIVSEVKGGFNAKTCISLAMFLDITINKSTFSRNNPNSKNQAKVSRNLFSENKKRFDTQLKATAKNNQYIFK